MRSGDKRDGNFTASEIGGLFQQFSESDIAKLDSRLDQVGWWADEIRLAYVRENRDAPYKRMQSESQPAAPSGCR